MCFYLYFTNVSRHLPFILFVLIQSENKLRTLFSQLTQTNIVISVPPLKPMIQTEYDFDTNTSADNITSNLSIPMAPLSGPIRRRHTEIVSKFATACLSVVKRDRTSLSISTKIQSEEAEAPDDATTPRFSAANPFGRSARSVSIVSPPELYTTTPRSATPGLGRALMAPATPSNASAMASYIMFRRLSGPVPFEMIYL